MGCGRGLACATSNGLADAGSGAAADGMTDGAIGAVELGGTAD